MSASQGNIRDMPPPALMALRAHHQKKLEAQRQKNQAMNEKK